MTGLVPLGRLPDRPARLVLVSGEYPEMAERLRKLGIDTVATIADTRLPAPIQWHPDMQACTIGGKMIVLKNNLLSGRLKECGILAEETFDVPGQSYPKDVLCNVLAWNKWALGNAETADKAVLLSAKRLKAVWLNVKQGYAACATALINEQSAITADKGIADKLERISMQVLRISPGAIRLPGYPYGFIGGCCGKLAPDLMAFTGSLDSHPDGREIRNFLAVRGVQALELMEGELLDTGGFIALD